MGLKAGNPVVAGTVLRRAAIQSPDYVTGSAGWAIKQDGTAEFNDAVIRGGQVIEGTSLYYNGSPAAGNLLASVSAASGTDDFGNAYLAGIATYVQSSGKIIATVVNPGAGNPGLWFYVANTEVGPYNTVASLTSDTNGNQTISGDLQALGSLTGEFLKATGPLASSIVGGLTVDTQDITSAQANASLLDITNTTASINALLRFFAANTGQVINARVSGDANPRFKLNADGSMQWGAGVGNQDTNLYRAGSASLAADPISMNIGGNPETWHNFGAFATGLSATAAKYRQNPSNGALDISIRNLAISGTATVTDGATILTAANGLPTRYQPVTPKRLVAFCNQIRVVGTNVDEMCALEIEIDGSIQCFGIAAAATRLDFHQSGIPIDI